jgi:N-alpha-acetyl-L-2,4-diaminobutyrate deacetylase
MYDTAAEEMGKVFVTTELRGGGTATAETVEYAKTGLRNLLVHSGILKGEVARRETTWLSMEADGCFIFCDSPGLLEPFRNLGDRVKKGDPLFAIHPIHRTGLEPRLYTAPHDGIIVCRLQSCLARMGDNLAVVATFAEAP